MGDGAAGYELTITVVGTGVVGIAEDVNLAGSATEIDDTVRDDNGWNSVRQGHKRFDLDIGMLYVPSEAAHVALLAAWLNGTTVSCQLRDANGWGWNFDAKVLTYTENQPLDDKVDSPVTLRSKGAPTRVTGTS